MNRCQYISTVCCVVVHVYGTVISQRLNQLVFLFQIGNDGVFSFLGIYIFLIRSHVSERFTSTCRLKLFVETVDFELVDMLPRTFIKCSFPFLDF